MFRYLRFVALTLTLASAGLLAQEFRGTVLGRVTDPSGAVLPGAAISLTNEETNVRYDAKSNPEGNYNVPFLMPGRYTVAVQADGFRKSVRPGIIVQVNDKITLNFELQLGQAADAITVTAESPVLQTATADMGQVVERQFIERLPMSGQNAMNLVDLAPGVLGGSGHQMSNEQNDIAINGGSGGVRGNEITVDGIPNVNPRMAGLAVTVPSADAVQEFKVMTTMFDASNGRSNGGALSFSTKGGTNEFHGTAYYFYFDEVLNANGWQRNRLGQERSPINQWRAGGTVGGPVILPRYNGRNKTFFFVAYEQYRNQSDFTRYGHVPTDRERLGDFSQTLALNGAPLQVYDPFSTVRVGSATVRDAFPGAVIPLSRQNITGQATMNLYPLPNMAGASRVGTFNWSGSGIYYNDLKNFSTRVDQSVGSRQKLYLRASVLNAMDGRNPTALPGAYDLPSSAAGRTGDNQNPRHSKSAALDDSVVISPTLFASFRYGYTRTNLYEYFEGNQMDPALQKLPDVILRNQTSRGLAIMKMGENMPYFGSKVRTSINDTHSFYVTVNQLRGMHTLKYGVDSRVVRWNENNPGETQNGRFNFGNVFTRQDPTKSSTADYSGTAMASLLLGVPDSGDFGYTSALSMQTWYAAGFIQDDIKITPRLTINLGLRYELEMPLTERYDRISWGFDEKAPVPVKVPGMDLRGGLLFVNDGGRGRRGGEMDWNNFGPRFGFAYNHDSRTVVRGGYGIFYSSALVNLGGSGSVNTTSLGAQPSFNAVTRYTASVDGNRTPYATLANPFPNGLAVPTGAKLGLATELGNSISFTNPRRVLPYVQQWQFSIQREVGWKTVFEVGYVGSHSVKLLNSNNYNWNETPDQYLAQGTGAYNTLPNPFLGIFPSTATLGQGATVTQSQMWARFPQFRYVYVYGLNVDNALYHSMQARLQKRFSKGLTFVGNYTFSRNMFYDPTSVVNERHKRAVASIDRPHMLRFFATYQLPVGRRKAVGSDMPKWADAAIGGWELGGSFKATSGSPLSISERRGQPIPLSDPNLHTSVRDRLGDRVDTKTGIPLNPFFNTTVWQRLPDDFTISKEPPRYGWLRGPRTVYTSVTIFKTLNVREGMKFEVRGEVNNPFNTPVFGNPATDMSTPSTFGTITTAGGTRNINLSGKLRF